jgi:hypothetical protein
MTTNAVWEFTDALRTEQARDPRPIVGARVSAEFMDRLNEDARTLMLPQNRKGTRLRKCCGVTVYIGMVDKLEFDHASA